MESYLMMLYVTLDQESALKSFFVDQGWAFCKPDLSVTTDRLGSSTGPLHANRSCTRTSPRLVGKRKAETDQHRAPVVKTAKILHTVPSMSSNIAETDCVQTEQLDVTKETELFGICSSVDGGSSVSEDQGETLIKVETFDVSYNPDECDEEYDDDTDIDYEEAKTDDEEEPLTVTEDKSLNTLQGDIATDVPKATKDKKRKGIKLSKNTEVTTTQCATCQHFEKQAVIFENGPGIPDEEPDELTIYICDVCGKQFMQQYAYRRHLRSHDESVTCPNQERERKWKCNVCEKVFGSEGNLNEHVSHVHLRKPGEFMCHLCPKSYTRTARLEAHLNCHYGIKPYSCKSCLINFFGKSSLGEHQKKCAGGTIVRFRCQLCLVYFGSQTDLKLHRKHEHADVCCISPCGKRMRWKSSIKKHIANCVKCKDFGTENKTDDTM